MRVLRGKIAALLGESVYMCISVWMRVLAYCERNLSILIISSIVFSRPLFVVAFRPA